MLLKLLFIVEPTNLLAGLDTAPKIVEQNY